MMKGGKVILEGELEAIRAEHGKFMRIQPFRSFKQKNRTIIPQRLQK